MSQPISRIFTLPEFRWESIKSYLPPLFDYAKNLGVSPISINVKHLFGEDSKTEISLPIVEVSFSLPEIEIGPYEFIGLLEHSKEGSNQIRLGALENIQKEILHRPPCCEFSKDNQLRSHTLVLQDKTSQKQIQLDPTSVSAFTRFSGADALVNYILNLAVVMDRINQEAVRPIDEELLYGGGVKNCQVKTEKVIATALAIVDKMQGVYLSREKCGEDQIPTGQLVKLQMLSKTPPFPDHKIYLPYLEKAREIIDWFANQPESRFNWSSYAHKLKNIVSSPECSFHFIPMIASAFSIYDQHHANKTKRFADRQADDAEKIEKKLMICRSHTYKNQFGHSFVHVLQDEEGNTYKWDTKAKLTVIHHTYYHVSAAVKKHSEINGYTQTELSFVKFPDVSALDKIKMGITPKQLTKLLDTFHDFGVIRAGDRRGIIETLMDVSETPELLLTFLNHPNCNLTRDQWYLLLSSVHYFDNQFEQGRNEIYQILRNYDFRISPADIDLVVTGKTSTNIKEILREFVDEDYYPVEAKLPNSSSMNP